MVESDDVFEQERSDLFTGPELEKHTSTTPVEMTTVVILDRLDKINTRLAKLDDALTSVIELTEEITEKLAEMSELRRYDD